MVLTQQTSDKCGASDGVIIVTIDFVWQVQIYK